jgi:hypothetical protein
MRALLGLALLAAMPAMADAESASQPLTSRFAISDDSIESVPDDPQGGRFALQSGLVARSARMELEGALFSLKAQLGVEGAGCAPDSIFEDGFEVLP